MPPSPAPSILSSAEAFAGRNTEGVHNSLLSGWKDHHTTVQENATRILKLHRVEEERKAAEQAANAAEKLLAEETAKALAEKRRIEAENARKQIPPPPKVQPTQVQQEAVPGPSIIPEVQTPAAQKPARAATPPSSVQQIFEQTIEQKVEISAPKAEPSFGQSQSTKAQIQPIPPALQANPTQFQQSTPPVQTMTTSPQAAISLQSQQDVSTTAPTPSVHNTAPAHKLPSDLDRLAEIHKNLKHLRKMVMDQEKTFRAKAGDMRRIIVRSLGQLTPGPNKQQRTTIETTLRESFQVPGPQVDPQLLMLARPEPDTKAHNNGPTLPLLFLYLLNIVAKSVINQLVNEASAKPEQAEPIAICAMMMFSSPAFLWRNEPLIDILKCKYAKACPILFGATGHETTEEGRARLGWKKENGAWLSAQEHADRMNGLGLGFASLTLRNYGNTGRTNPWKPNCYWKAVAEILNTPPDQICTSQYVVLKALLENYAMKFVNLYGDSAKAVLRVATTVFPSYGQGPAAGALQLLSEQWQKSEGFYLD